MKKFLDKFKNLIGDKKEKVTLKSAFDNMHTKLAEVENAYGKDFFPKEKNVSVEVMHYRALKLENEASFDEIKAQYGKLKKEYSSKGNEKISKDDAEVLATIEFAYNYFKKKFVG